MCGCEGCEGLQVVCEEPRRDGVCVGGEVEGDTKIYNYAHTSN